MTNSFFFFESIVILATILLCLFTNCSISECACIIHPVLKQNPFVSPGITRRPSSWGGGIKETLDQSDKEHGSDGLIYILDRMFTHSQLMRNSFDQCYKGVVDCYKSFSRYPSCPNPPEAVNVGKTFKSINYKDYYKLDAYFMEVVVKHHGLLDAPQQVRDYLRDKDFIDVGSCHGESLVVLQNYTKGKLYAYEISPKNVEKIQMNIKNNGIEDRVVIIQKGLSDVRETRTFNDDGAGTTNLHTKGSTTVEMALFDDEVKRLGINPGYIKCDVEGFGYRVIKGCKDVFTKFRPVISFSIYHNFDEHFRIPEFIAQFPNYIFEFHCNNDFAGSTWELTVFAYPAELIYQRF